MNRNSQLSGQSSLNVQQKQIKTQKLNNLKKELRETLLFEVCADQELLDRTKKRLEHERKVHENNLVTKRLQARITSMFSSKNLNHLSLNVLPFEMNAMIRRVDHDIQSPPTQHASQLSFKNNKRRKGPLKTKSNLDLDQIMHIHNNKQTVGAKKFESIHQYKMEMPGPPLRGLSGSFSKNDEISPGGLSSFSQPFGDPQDGQQQSPRAKAVTEQLEQLNSTNPDNDQETQMEFKLKQQRRQDILQLKVSTGEKQRQEKRRGITISMKFIRRLGKELREDLDKQSQMIKKFQQQQLRKLSKTASSSKIQNLGKKAQSKKHIIPRNRSFQKDILQGIMSSRKNNSFKKSTSALLNDLKTTKQITQFNEKQLSKTHTNKNQHPDQYFKNMNNNLSSRQSQSSPVNSQVSRVKLKEKKITDQLMSMDMSRKQSLSITNSAYDAQDQFLAKSQIPSRNPSRANSCISTKNIKPTPTKTDSKSSIDLICQIQLFSKTQMTGQGNQVLLQSQESQENYYGNYQMDFPLINHEQELIEINKIYDSNLEEEEYYAEDSSIDCQEVEIKPSKTPAFEQILSQKVAGQGSTPVTQSLDSLSNWQSEKAQKEEIKKRQSNSSGKNGSLSNLSQPQILNNSQTQLPIKNEEDPLEQINIEESTDQYQQLRKSKFGRLREGLIPSGDNTNKSSERNQESQSNEFVTSGPSSDENTEFKSSPLFQLQQMEALRENTLSQVTEEADQEDHETSFGHGNASGNQIPTHMQDDSNTSEMRSDGDLQSFKQKVGKYNTLQCFNPNGQVNFQSRRLSTQLSNQVEKINTLNALKYKQIRPKSSNTIKNLNINSLNNVTDYAMKRSMIIESPSELMQGSSNSFESQSLESNDAVKNKSKEKHKSQNFFIEAQQNCIPEIKFKRFTTQQSPEKDDSTKENFLKNQGLILKSSMSNSQSSPDSSELVSSYDSDEERDFNQNNLKSNQWQMIKSQNASAQTQKNYTVDLDMQPQSRGSDQEDEELLSSSSQSLSSEEEAPPELKSKMIKSKIKANPLIQLGPMLSRGDIAGDNEDLSDIEEFYLAEIEMQFNGEQIEKIQREEDNLKREIRRQQSQIPQVKQSGKPKLTRKEDESSPEKLVKQDSNPLQRQNSYNFSVISKRSISKYSSSNMKQYNKSNNVTPSIGGQHSDMNFSDRRHKETEKLKLLKNKLQSQRALKFSFAFTMNKKDERRLSDHSLFQKKSEVESSFDNSINRAPTLKVQTKQTLNISANIQGESSGSIFELGTKTAGGKVRCTDKFFTNPLNGINVPQSSTIIRGRMMSGDVWMDKESGLLDINCEDDVQSSVSSKSLVSGKPSQVSDFMLQIKPKIILGHSNQWLDDYSKKECRRITELSDRNIGQSGESYRDDALIFGQAVDESPLPQILPAQTMNQSRSRESLRIVSSDMQNSHTIKTKNEQDKQRPSDLEGELYLEDSYNSTINVVGENGRNATSPAYINDSSNHSLHPVDQVAGEMAFYNNQTQVFQTQSRLLESAQNATAKKVASRRGHQVSQQNRQANLRRSMGANQATVPPITQNIPPLLTLPATNEVSPMLLDDNESGSEISSAQFKAESRREDSQRNRPHIQAANDHKKSPIVINVGGNSRTRNQLSMASKQNSVTITQNQKMYYSFESVIEESKTSQKKQPRVLFSPKNNVDQKKILKDMKNNLKDLCMDLEQDNPNLQQFTSTKRRSQMSLNREKQSIDGQLNINFLQVPQQQQTVQNKLAKKYPFRHQKNRSTMNQLGLASKQSSTNEYRKECTWFDDRRSVQIQDSSQIGEVRSLEPQYINTHESQHKYSKQARNSIEIDTNYLNDSLNPNDFTGGGFSFQEFHSRQPSRISNYNNRLSGQLAQNENRVTFGRQGSPLRQNTLFIKENDSSSESSANKLDEVTPIQKPLRKIFASTQINSPPAGIRNNRQFNFSQQTNQGYQRNVFTEKASIIQSPQNEVQVSQSLNQQNRSPKSVAPPQTYQRSPQRYGPLYYMQYQQPLQSQQPRAYTKSQERKRYINNEPNVPKISMIHHNHMQWVDSQSSFDLSVLEADKISLQKQKSVYTQQSLQYQQTHNSLHFLAHQDLNLNHKSYNTQSNQYKRYHQR